MNFHVVAMELDHPGFIVKDCKALQMVKNAIVRATQSEFPVEVLFKLWSNKEGQVSYRCVVIQGIEKLVNSTIKQAYQSLNKCHWWMFSKHTHSFLLFLAFFFVNLYFLCNLFIDNTHLSIKLPCSIYLWLYCEETSKILHCRSALCLASDLNLLHDNQFDIYAICPLWIRLLWCRYWQGNLYDYNL